MRSCGGALPVFGGIALGILSVLLPGSVFILFLAAGTGLLLAARTRSPDRRFILGIFWAAFLLRVAVSVGLDLGAGWRVGSAPFSPPGDVAEGPPCVFDRTRGYVRMDDSDDYSACGYAWARYAKGKREPPVLFPLNSPYGRNSYLFVLGGFYYLFGFSPITVKWINCLLGATLVPVIFALARACFNRVVARWACVLTAFFPSLVLWSASNLKEPALFLATATFFLFWFRFVSGQQLSKRLFIGVGLVGVGMIHASLREPLYTWVLFLSSGVAYLLTAPWRFRWRLPLLVALFAAVLFAWPRGVSRELSYVLWRHTLTAQIPDEPLGTLEHRYRFLPPFYYTEEGKMQLKHREFKATPTQLFPWAAKAWGHYLLEPLPWNSRGLFQLAVYPQLLFWYYCLFLAAMGIGFSFLRGVEGHTFCLLMGLISLSVIGALPSGNAGTVFRLRDIITPMVLIFACAGVRGWGDGTD